MKKLSIDSFIYSVGIFLNSVLGLIFYLVVARFLGPTLFGTLAIILALAVVVSDIFDLGLNTAIISLLPAEEAYQHKRVLSANFLSLKLLLSALVTIVGILVSPLIATTLFGNASLAGLITLGFISASVIILFGYVNSHLLAQKRFLPSVVLNIVSNSLRLLGVALIICILHGITVFWAIVLFVLPTAVSALVWFIADRNIVKKPALNSRESLRILHFSKWVAGSLAVGSLSARADNFILTMLSGVTQTGIYTAVQRFFLAFNQIPGAVGTVLAPDFSNQATGNRRPFLFGVAVSFLFSFGLILVAITSPILVPQVLGNRYLASVVPAQILALATIPFVFSIPLNSYLLYARKNSRAIFMATLIQLLIILAANYLLVPGLGAVGSAIAYGIGNVAALGLYAMILLGEAAYGRR